MPVLCIQDIRSSRFHLPFQEGCCKGFTSSGFSPFAAYQDDVQRLQWRQTSVLIYTFHCWGNRHLHDGGNGKARLDKRDQR